jgi:hypothetical protein
LLKAGIRSLFVIQAFLLISPLMLRAQVRGPLVVSDNWPECTDMLTWANDIFRLENVEKASERDRAIVFHNWLRLFSRLCEGVGGMAHAYEGKWGEEDFVSDAHKHLFVYGWGYCSTHSLIAEALWQEYLRDSLAADRVIVMHENGGYHTMHRLRMDGHYGAFDARYGYYLLERDTPDAHILDWDGVGDDSNIRANLKYENRCRPFFEFPSTEFERALWIKPKPVFQSEAAWRAAGTEPEVVFRDRKYKMGTRFHDMRFSLPRGMTIERYWNNRMKKWYIPEKNKDMFLSEGRFYRVGTGMVGADGEANDPNRLKMAPYLTDVPLGLGYPSYLEGKMSLGQAWGLIRYLPDLARGDLYEIMKEGGGLEAFHSAPFVRPDGDYGEGEWVLEFYCPYILVDGFIQGELVGQGEDRVEVAFRSQVPKRFNLDQPDEWLDWKVLADKPGKFLATLDRTDSAEGESSLHGTYRFQLRLRFDAAGEASRVGLGSLSLLAFFENGIMSIPQLSSGGNTIRFKVEDPAQVKSDILVTYAWQNAEGAAKSHEMLLTPGMFIKDNQAVYHIDAQGLARCNSLIISYP